MPGAAARFNDNLKRLRDVTTGVANTITAAMRLLEWNRRLPAL